MTFINLFSLRYTGLCTPDAYEALTKEMDRDDFEMHAALVHLIPDECVPDFLSFDESTGEFFNTISLKGVCT